MHRAFRLITLFGTLFTLASSHAQADNIEAFTLSGTYASAFWTANLGSPTGTVTIDTTTGVILSANISYSDYNPSLVVDNNNSWGYFPDVNLSNSWTTLGGNPYAAEFILLPVTSLVGYGGGPICSDANPCPVYGESSMTYLISSQDLATGQLSPVPEPSCLILLSTAALGFTRELKRKGASRQLSTRSA